MSGSEKNRFWCVSGSEKSRLCGSQYAKWRPFAFTHARSRVCHWSIALSMMPWGIWSQVGGLRSTNALDMNFFLLPLPVNLAVLTIWSLFNPLAVPARYRLSPFLAHQPSRHWQSQIAHSDMHHTVSGVNSIQDSFRQPRQSCLDSLPHSLVSSSLLSSPFSSFITPSLFHSRLQTYMFNKSFPP